MKEYTYLAGDWDYDKNIINKIKEWNKDPQKSLKYKDAHEITQARDESLNCSIKNSLGKRLLQSHTFVLIVGKKTIDTREGECSYCNSYYNGRCYHGYGLSNESYIEYECRKAVELDMKIIVIYNSDKIERLKCPEIVRYKGKHIVGFYYTANDCYWNYNEIANSIMY